MSDMEGIVRPFQSPVFINDKRAITKLPKVPSTGGTVLEWGALGAPPIINALGFDTKKDKDYKEKSRTTEDVRVENPDDPNQFIMERRIKTIKFDVKDPLEASTASGNNSGSANGTVSQTAYTQSSKQEENSKAYAALTSQGVPVDVASSMVYGQTFNGPLPKEAGPDSAKYTLKTEKGPDS